jgi:lysophospholipid hydrolase
MLNATATSLAANATSSVPAGAQSTTGMLGGLLLGVFTIIPSLLYWVVSFITITLPTWIFSFLSRSFTLTLNMTTLLVLLLAFASTVSWFVRYRFLNMYSRLPPEPQRKEPQVEVFPEPQEHDSKPGLSNYFDEFLSAIKVFGYLERPVFHELTRTMQTKKLIAGETLLLEEEKGFCLVVDGLVQIFVKSNRANSTDDDNNDSAIDDDTGDDSTSGNRTYQLLTEVKNGAPMSSLFSILALFTETVKLRHDDDDETPEQTASRQSLRDQSSFAMSTPNGTSTPASGAASPMGWNGATSRPASASRHRSSTTNGQGISAFKEPPPLALDSSGEHQHQQQSRYPSFAGGAFPKPSRHTKTASAHPDIVARATVDTTIAIIPATAFHRLTFIF